MRRQVADGELYPGEQMAEEERVEVRGLVVAQGCIEDTSLAVRADPANWVVIISPFTGIVHLA